jgi:hypothetical protein
VVWQRLINRFQFTLTIRCTERLLSESEYNHFDKLVFVFVIIGVAVDPQPPAAALVEGETEAEDATDRVPDHAAAEAVAGKGEMEAEGATAQAPDHAVVAAAATALEAVAAVAGEGEETGAGAEMKKKRKKSPKSRSHRKSSFQRTWITSLFCGVLCYISLQSTSSCQF